MILPPRPVPSLPLLEHLPGGGGAAISQGLGDGWRPSRSRKFFRLFWSTIFVLPC